jgi:hypothetical protein
MVQLMGPFNKHTAVPGEKLGMHFSMYAFHVALHCPRHVSCCGELASICADALG